VRIVTLLVYDSPAQTGTGPRPRLPAFDFFLRRGRTTQHSELDPVAWLCSRYGLAPDPDWPVAPLLARTARLASVHPVWLCADPVHIRLDSRRLTVIPASALSLSKAEGGELVDALDRHFSPRGQRLFAFDRDRWLINSSLPARIDSGPLPGISSDAGRILASGPDAGHWNGFLNEAQMLLHAHPVNAARQARGEPEINSLHLWGAGSNPLPKAPDRLVVSDDPLTLALGATSGAIIAGTAAELLDRMQTETDASALIVRRASGESSSVADHLVAIDRDWLAPMLQHLRGRRLDCLELVIPQAPGMLGHKVTGSAFWMFWKRLPPFSRITEARIE